MVVKIIHCQWIPVLTQWKHTDEPVQTPIDDVSTTIKFGPLDLHRTSQNCQFHVKTLR
jgi:hypothetical protein